MVEWPHGAPENFLIQVIDAVDVYVKNSIQYYQAKCFACQISQ